MEKEFATYEQALALKELGFDEDCFKYYTEEFKLGSTGLYYAYDNPIDFLCLAPLYQQTFRWFREKYDLNYVIVKAESWFYTINGCNTQEGFNTYEEAELECLKKLIEIVKEKK